MADDDSKTYAKTLKDQEIFSVGTWNNDPYTEADLDSMVSAFNSVHPKVPLKLGHDDSQKWFGQKDGAPALGWVENLRRLGTKLVADFVNVPNVIVDLIGKKAYRSKSSEIYWNLKDQGTIWPRVLKAVSLLGADIPAVSNLNELQTILMSNTTTASNTGAANSTGTVTCNYYTVSGTSVWPYGSDATWAVVKSYGSEDFREGVKDMTAEETKVYTDKIAKLTEDLTGEKKRADDAEARAVKAEADLSSRDEKHAIEQFTVQVDALVKEGKVLPAEKEDLILQFVAFGSGEKKYNDKSFKPREILLSALNAREKRINFSSTAQGGEKKDESDKPVVVKVDEMAKKISSEKKITYTEALAVVKNESPELWAEYLKG